MMAISQATVFQDFLNFNTELLNTKYIKQDKEFSLELLLQLKRQLREADARLRYYEDIDAKIERRAFYLLSLLNRVVYEEEYNRPPLDGSYYFITITFDPSRFKNIHLVPEGKQIEYIKICILKSIQDKIIDNIYGSYEYHAGRRVMHFHGIIESATNIDRYNEILTYFTKLFSSKPNNPHCIDLSRVKDLTKVINYIEKADENDPSTKEFDEMIFTPKKRFLLIKKPLEIS